MRILPIIIATATLCGTPTMGKTGVVSEGNRIVMATDHVAYTVGTDGINQSFKDLRTGKDYLFLSDDPGHFMSIQQDGIRDGTSRQGPPLEGKWTGSTAVQWRNGFLWVTFANTGIQAKIHVRTFSNYLTFKLVSLNDHSISSIQLVRLPLTLTKHIGRWQCRDDTFGAAVISLNIETHVFSDSITIPSETGNQKPQFHRPVFTAHADQEVRLEGAQIAVLGCPSENLLDILGQIEIENGLPHPTIDGVWSKKSPAVMKSQIYGHLSQDTVDEMIEYAKLGGFGTIVIYHRSLFDSHGSYTLNREYWKEDAALKTASDKIHAAGLKFGVHNLNLVISKHDSLITPIPAAGLMSYASRQRILAEQIGPTDKFLPTTTSPRGLLAKGDKSIYHGRTLKIEDELIVYDALQTEEPFGFAATSDQDTYDGWHGNYRGCIRGAFGTQATAHPAGSKIENLFEFVSGYYRPDVTSHLFDRVIQNMASFLDRFEFDYLYPDGMGQNIGYEAEGPGWYIRNLVPHKLYHCTQREVRTIWGTWHTSSMGGEITDVVTSGVMATFNQSLRGAKNARANLQPTDFGWLSYVSQGTNHEATRPRMMEYAWSKALAYGAAISLSSDLRSFKANGRTREIFANIKKWEELKIAGYFPESLRQQMQKLNHEFALESTSTGQWQIRPVVYSPEKYVGKEDGQQNVWSFFNSHAPQAIRTSIRPMPQLAEYGNPDNVAVLTPGPLTLRTTGRGPMWGERQTDGFELKLGTSDEGSPGGEITFAISAANRGAQQAGWGCAEVMLDHPKDLRGHRGLGTWVKGDGSNAVLHFTFERSEWQARDYYVRLDFEDWKYIQMPVHAGEEIYEFQFPYSFFTALAGFNYQDIPKMYVFITNLPPGATANVKFGRLEALQETPRSLKHPALRVNGQPLTFPVILEPDSYLELDGSGTARVFDPNGHTENIIHLKGNVPELLRGENQITFACDQQSESGQAASITLVTRGKPLRNQSEQGQSDRE